MINSEGSQPDYKSNGMGEKIFKPCIGTYIIFSILYWVVGGTIASIGVLKGDISPIFYVILGWCLLLYWIRQQTIVITENYICVRNFFRARKIAIADISFYDNFGELDSPFLPPLRIDFFNEQKKHLGYINVKLYSREDVCLLLEYAADHFPLYSYPQKKRESNVGCYVILLLVAITFLGLGCKDSKLVNVYLEDVAVFRKNSTKMYFMKNLSSQKILTPEYQYIAHLDNRSFALVIREEGGVKEYRFCYITSSGSAVVSSEIYKDIGFGKITLVTTKDGKSVLKSRRVNNMLNLTTPWMNGYAIKNQTQVVDSTGTVLFARPGAELNLLKAFHNMFILCDYKTQKYELVDRVGASLLPDRVQCTKTLREIPSHGMVINYTSLPSSQTFKGFVSFHDMKLYKLPDDTLHVERALDSDLFLISPQSDSLELNLQSGGIRFEENIYYFYSIKQGRYIIHKGWLSNNMFSRPRRFNSPVHDQEPVTPLFVGIKKHNEKKPKIMKYVDFIQDVKEKLK